MALYYCYIWLYYERIVARCEKLGGVRISISLRFDNIKFIGHVLCISLEVQELFAGAIMLYALGAP